MRPVIAFVFVLLLMSCASDPQPDRMGFEDARAMFAGRGPQVGQKLPPLSLVDLAGKSITLASVQRDRPLVLVTASLTCNVARRQQADVDALRARVRDDVAVVVIYTIDAHPKGDVCPYTGKEWVPKDNEKDEVLVPQPTTLEERLKLARDFLRRFSDNAVILVDTMDNASWKALGEAPNLGLLVDRNDIVREREGWFDAKAMEKAVAALK